MLNPPASWPFDVSALLLDMDGTLIDSTPSVERAWGQFFRERGSDLTFGHDMHGIPARGTIRRVFPEYSDAEVEEAHSRVEQLEMDDAGSIEILPGTARILAALDEISAEVGRPVWTIVTSCTRPLFEKRWATTGLPHPAHLVTSDQVERGKPHPDPFLLGMERLGFSGSDVLAAEDSRGGLTAARDAGAITLGLSTTTPVADLEPLSDAVVTSLDDIDVALVDGRIRVTRRDQ